MGDPLESTPSTTLRGTGPVPTLPRPGPRNVTGAPDPFSGPTLRVRQTEHNGEDRGSCCRSRWTPCRTTPTKRTSSRTLPSSWCWPGTTRYWRHGTIPSWTDGRRRSRGRVWSSEPRSCGKTRPDRDGRGREGRGQDRPGGIGRVGRGGTGREGTVGRVRSGGDVWV